MFPIGTIETNLFTTKEDETVYVTALHNVSHTDTVALSRNLPKDASQPLRTRMRSERGFSVGDGVPEKNITVNVACVVPKGVDPVAAKAYVKLIMLQAADTTADLAISGDIHLEAAA